MNNYDGVFRRPFLAEHWHKGFVGAAAMWLPVCWLLVAGFDASLKVAAIMASVTSLVLLVAVLTHHEGFAVQLSPRRYRRYTWVLGLRFGTWQQLPQLSHITIRPYQVNHTLTATKSTAPVQLSLQSTERNWQVLLGVTGSSIGIIAAYNTEEKSEVIAALLSQLLGVEVLKRV